MAQHDDDLQQRPELRLHDRSELIFKRIRVQTAHTDRTVMAFDAAGAFREVMELDRPGVLGEFTAFSIEGGPKELNRTDEMIARCTFTAVLRRRLVNAITPGVI